MCPLCWDRPAQPALAGGEWSVPLLPPGDLLQSPTASMPRGAKLTLQHLVAAVLADSAAQHACGSQPEHADREKGLPVAWTCLEGSALAGSPPRCSALALLALCHFTASTAQLPPFM